MSLKGFFSTVSAPNFVFVGFILLMVLGIWVDFLWILLLPIVGIILYVFFFKHDVFYWIIFSIVPLSVGLEKFSDYNLGLYFPTEPMIIASCFLLLLKFSYDRSYPLKYLKHPLSMIIILHLVWMFITALTSTMVLVSLKFFLVRFWYVFCFFFYMMLIFEKNPLKNIKIMFWCYFIPLLGVVIYALFRLSAFKYDEKAAHWVMQPFFKDHTSYGAILAMITPFLFAVTFKKRANNNHYILLFFVALIFLAGLVFSYTRAAWVSLLGAFTLFLFIKLKLSTKHLLGLGLIVLLILSINFSSLMQSMEKNKQDASDDLVEHVQSISNIASDASNLERINRWSCAIKMFQEKPLLGWGPGTYMFQYAPFQHSKQMTIISTNFGDGGNAHSEYLGPLAESGLFGSLLFIAIVVLLIYYGIKTHANASNEYKPWIMVVLTGFVTYILHGFLNNYLDTDKASVLFWSFCAFIVLIDLRQSAQKSTRE